MSKFGLDAFENEAETEETPSLAERLAAFPPSGPRTHIDLAAVDAAAAPHGFTSREPSVPEPSSNVAPPQMVPFYPPPPNYPPAPLYPQAAAAAAAVAAQQSAQAPPPPAPVHPPAAVPSQGYVPPAAGYPPPLPGRRRRAMTYEPTRHLAIRLTETQYQRFVAFADEHRLTYHDALQKLMDEHASGGLGG